VTRITITIEILTITTVLDDIALTSSFDGHQGCAELSENIEAMVVPHKTTEQAVFLKKFVI
jgi:hypothetical protein